ncbi:MAG: SCO family protein [Burkholderiales bacterium]
MQAARPADRGLAVARLALTMAWFLAAWFFAVRPAAAADATLDRDYALKTSQAAVGKRPANYTFTASDGRGVELARFRGKPLVVSFVYTGCFQVCPASTQFLKLAAAQAETVLGKDRIALATIGFNLPFDSPEAMRDFARRQGVSATNWVFLTPQAAQRDALLADFGFSHVATPKGFDHILQATILDAEGRIVKQVYGESFSLDAFVEPLKALVAGAPLPANDLGSVIEKLRLLCTVYDPVSGEYRPDYALFAEMLGGLLVIVATALFLLQDRRRAPRRH